MSLWSNRLGKSPLRDLIIYDGLRVAEDTIFSEIEYDTEGVAFTVEKKNISNLTLYKLFTEIFINRCGFIEWKSNIPDSAIKQASFSVGNSFMDGIAPHCGIFEPDFTMVGTILWVRDTTNLLPAGFPVSAQLTIDDYESAGVTQEIDRLDAFRVIFNEDKDDWDSWQQEVVILPVSENGEIFTSGYSRTEIKTNN